MRNGSSVLRDNVGYLPGLYRDDHAGVNLRKAVVSLIHGCLFR